MAPAWSAMADVSRRDVSRRAVSRRDISRDVRFRSRERLYNLTSIECMGTDIPSKKKGRARKDGSGGHTSKNSGWKKRKEKHNSYRGAVGRHPSLSIPYILECRLLRSGGRVILLEDDVLDWPARTHVDLSVQGRASFVESWFRIDSCL